MFYILVIGEVGSMIVQDFDLIQFKKIMLHNPQIMPINGVL